MSAPVPPVSPPAPAATPTQTAALSAVQGTIQSTPDVASLVQGQSLNAVVVSSSSGQLVLRPASAAWRCRPPPTWRPERPSWCRCSRSARRCRSRCNSRIPLRRRAIRPCRAARPRRPAPSGASPQQAAAPVTTHLTEGSIVQAVVTRGVAAPTPSGAANRRPGSAPAARRQPAPAGTSQATGGRDERVRDAGGHAGGRRARAGARRQPHPAGARLRAAGRRAAALIPRKPCKRAPDRPPGGSWSPRYPAISRAARRSPPAKPATSSSPTRRRCPSAAACCSRCWTCRPRPPGRARLALLRARRTLGSVERGFDGLAARGPGACPSGSPDDRSDARAAAGRDHAVLPVGRLLGRHPPLPRRGLRCASSAGPPAPSATACRTTSGRRSARRRIPPGRPGGSFSFRS